MTQDTDMLEGPAFVELDIHLFARQDKDTCYRVDLSIHELKYGPVTGYIDDSELHKDEKSDQR